MKILIIRLSSLGDVILSTFALRLIRKKFPDAHIDFLVAKEYAHVLRFNPNVQNVYEYDKNLAFSTHLFNTLSLFNQSHYDIILDLQNNIRSRVFSLGKSERVFRFNKRRFYKLSLVYLKKRKTNFVHIPVLYKNTLPDLANFDDGLGLELWTPKDSNGYVPFNKKQNLKNIQKVAIAPGAKHFTKRLPQKIATQVVEQILYKYDAKIFLIGSTEDFSYCKELVVDSTRVSNLCGEFDVPGTGAFLDDCDIVISTDSAAVHIASARQIPTIVIYGSTVPELGFAPFRVPYEIVEINNLTCRPCSHIGRSKCPLKHFDCMNKITSGMVIEAIEKLTTK
jgi:heptosyltransferase-2